MSTKKKPERRSEEQHEEWKRKNKKWLESIMIVPVTDPMDTFWDFDK